MIRRSVSDQESWSLAPPDGSRRKVLFHRYELGMRPVQGLVSTPRARLRVRSQPILATVGTSS